MIEAYVAQPNPVAVAISLKMNKSFVCVTTNKMRQTSNAAANGAKQ